MANTISNKVGGNKSDYKSNGQNTLGPNVFKPDVGGTIMTNKNNPRIKLENSIRYDKQKNDQYNQ